MSNNCQIIPFPLPDYLATYFANQLSSEVEVLPNGTEAKAFHIRKHSELGKFIMRHLKQSGKKPEVKKGITIYLAVGNHVGEKDPCQVVKRYTYVDFDEAAIKSITGLFKSIFESSLISFVLGATFVNNKRNNVKGVTWEALEKFCEINGVTYTNKNFDSWKKLVYRAKQRPNPFTHKVL